MINCYVNHVFNSTSPMQIHLAEKLRGAFSHAYFLPEIDGFLEMRIRLNTVYTPNQIDYKRKRSHPLSFRQKMRRWWLEEEKKKCRDCTLHDGSCEPPTPPIPPTISINNSEQLKWSHLPLAFCINKLTAWLECAIEIEQNQTPTYANLKILNVNWSHTNTRTLTTTTTSRNPRLTNI